MTAASPGAATGAATGAAAAPSSLSAATPGAATGAAAISTPSITNEAITNEAITNEAITNEARAAGDREAEHHDARLRRLLPFPSDPSIAALAPAQVYCVGGAVRDALLGRAVEERDWVVVGSTPQAMHAAGFRPVGRGFPVFLHRQSGEEYALARTERQTGRGYHGFQFHCDPSVSLEDDLLRRDLRINAMALDAAGRLVDPYGGMADLQAGWLRHLSDAFREDPVRILRVARLAATLPDFRVHPDTLALMRAMVQSGETAYWVAERVWREIERGMQQARPSAMWRCLAQTGAEPFATLGAEHKTMLDCIDKAASEGAAPLLRWGVWAALAGTDFTTAVSTCLRMPREVRSMVQLSRDHSTTVLECLLALDAQADEQAAHRIASSFRTSADAAQGAALISALLQLFEGIDLLRRPERLGMLIGIAMLHPQLDELGSARRVRAIEQLREAAASFAAPTAGTLGAEMGESAPTSGPHMAAFLRSARQRSLHAWWARRYASDADGA